MDAKWKQRLRRRLMTWYEKHGRELPWRDTDDPYRVWVSEIMLQQTQVATVIPYYHRFLDAFPTVERLAAAPEAEVLRLWEGLGYYRRARQLHAAAKVVAGEFQGQFPADAATARKLPGIGRYTAGAILSIALGRREPILEANTVRLFSRLLAVQEDLTDPQVQKRLWDFSADILPQKRVGHFNQALMDLGSTVCVPKGPDCANCPVMVLCPTHAQGLQDRIPRAKPRTKYEAVTEACVVVRRGERVLLRRCGAGERWAGLWDFPRIGLPSPLGEATSLSHSARESLAEGVRTLTGCSVTPRKHLLTLKHGVTRFRITLHCFEAVYRRGGDPDSALTWVAVESLADYPLSVTGRKIAQFCRKAYQGAGAGSG